MPLLRQLVDSKMLDDAILNLVRSIKTALIEERNNHLDLPAYQTGNQIVGFLMVPTQDELNLSITDIRYNEETQSYEFNGDLTRPEEAEEFASRIDSEYFLECLFTGKHIDIAKLMKPVEIDYSEVDFLNLPENNIETPDSIGTGPETDYLKENQANDEE
jgi:hypothetical protein